MRKLIIILITFTIALSSIAQTIENVDFKYIDEKIVIYFDLVNCIDGYMYEIEIKFADEKGNTIAPRSNMTGDFGLVSCGKNKKAIWDLFQEVDKFEGNYKVLVSITNTFNSKGKKVVAKVDKKIRIVDTEKVGDKINVELSNGVNNKIKTNDLFFVTSSNKISLATGKKTLKIGKLNIIETINASSKGLLTLNNQLNYEQVNNAFKDFRFSKFHRYNIYLNALGSSSEALSALGFGLGIATLSLKSNNSFGLEFNILFYSEGAYNDINLFYVISPYALNSKYVSVGFNIHPLTKNQTTEYLQLKIKPKIGIFSGFQYDRLKLKLGIEFGKTIAQRNMYINDIYTPTNYTEVNFNLYSSISFSLFK